MLQVIAALLFERAHSVERCAPCILSAPTRTDLQTRADTASYVPCLSFVSRPALILRHLLFWDVTRRMLVLCYRRFDEIAHTLFYFLPKDVLI
jgi:hypothetical protein